MAVTFPPVIQQADACPISWIKTAMSFIGFKIAVFQSNKLIKRKPPKRQQKMISSVWQQVERLQSAAMVKEITYLCDDAVHAVRGRRRRARRATELSEQQLFGYDGARLPVRLLVTNP
jgi:hypothetical protein